MLGSRPAPGSRVGLGAIFASAPSEYGPGVIHMAIGDGGYVGLVRVESGALNVAAALDPAWIRTHASPSRAVAALLAQAGFAPLTGTPERAWQGTPKLTRPPVARVVERVFAVGDAAGYVEPFTGEGMAWALGCAQALAPFAARAAVHWDPALGRAWIEEQNRLLSHAQRLCRAVAWTSRRRRLAAASLSVLARFPAVAAPFVRHAAAPLGPRRPVR